MYIGFDRELLSVQVGIFFSCKKQPGRGEPFQIDGCDVVAVSPPCVIIQCVIIQCVIISTIIRVSFFREHIKSSNLNIIYLLYPTVNTHRVI
jgi:hypothetical protein